MATWKTCTYLSYTYLHVQSSIAYIFPVFSSVSNAICLHKQLCSRLPMQTQQHATTHGQKTPFFFTRFSSKGLFFLSLSLSLSARSIIASVETLSECSREKSMHEKSKRVNSAGKMGKGEEKDLERADNRTNWRSQSVSQLVKPP